MKELKVSIIVPVYNAEKYLEKCLESLVNQSLDDIEILVVNDGSKDNSLSIMEKKSDEYKKIKVINKENKGVSEARNSALKIAKGKYILNVDSDDWLDKECCKEMYLSMEKNDLDILICDFYCEKFGKQIYTKDLNLKDEKVIDYKSYLQEFFTSNFVGFNCNKMFKRRLIIENNLTYEKNIGLMEDVLMLVRLAKKSSKISKLNKAYYHYVQHDNNVTNNLQLNHLHNVNQVFDILKKELEKDYKLLVLVQKRWELTFLSLALQLNLEKKERLQYLVNEKLKEFNFKNISGFKTKKRIYILNSLIYIFTDFKTIVIFGKILSLIRFLKKIVKKLFFNGRIYK